MPIVGLSPIEFDGSTSRGAGLSYFIEFGDRQVSTERRVIHRVNEHGGLTARLTIVDRFGRTDSEAVPYITFALGNWLGDGWWYADGVSKFLRFNFLTRNGLNYGGTAYYGYESLGGRWAPFLATVSGERDIRIVVQQLGLEFRGYVDLASTYSHGIRMILAQAGGADDGATWTLSYDDGPG